MDESGWTCAKCNDTNCIDLTVLDVLLTGCKYMQGKDSCSVKSNEKKSSYYQNSLEVEKKVLVVKNDQISL